MTINREHLAGLKLAKEILGGYTADQVSDSPYTAITDAIAQAQAAPEAEPVAWLARNKAYGYFELTEPHEKATNPKHWTDSFPVYTAPQHDAELVELLRAVRDCGNYAAIPDEVTDRIDAKLATLRGPAHDE